MLQQKQSSIKHRSPHPFGWLKYGAQITRVCVGRSEEPKDVLANQILHSVSVMCTDGACLEILKAKYYGIILHESIEMASDSFTDRGVSGLKL